MTTTGRVAMLWALALGGCTAMDAHSFDHSAGWRAAQVVSVGQVGELASTVDRDCGADGGATAPYAVVRYRNGGVHTRSLGTGRWPAGGAPKVGDAVHVNILDCAAPMALADQKRSASGTPPPH